MDPRDTSNREQLSVREVAERFIQLFYVEDNPRDAFLCWVHPDYIQHNPSAPTGRDATLAMMEASIATTCRCTSLTRSSGRSWRGRKGVEAGAGCAALGCGSAAVRPS